MFRLASFCIILFGATVSVNSVVIRHDKSDNSYKQHQAPEALFDMRHQGHGVLIAPEWVVTAAHLIFYDYKDKTITLGTTEHEIDYVIFHPGYSKPKGGLFNGYSGPSQAYLRHNHDMVLVKLKEPVSDVKPARMYRGTQEAGQEFKLFGKGNTGSGLTGQIDKSGGDVLRRASNIVDLAERQWLYYDFDRGSQALPDEGIQGDGDSGGPAFAQIDNQQQLIGLASWNVYDGDIAEFKGGLYGMSGALIRVSYYADWVNDVQNWSEDKLLASHNKLGGR